MVIALLTLTSVSALAREPSPAWNDVLAIEGHLGVATPLGLAGLALDLTPHPSVSVSAGVGRGLFAMQLAAMARVRPFFVTPGIAPGIGAGVSRGGTGTWELMDSRQLRIEQATWLNGELFVEFRRGRVHLRPFFGIARRLGLSGCAYVDVSQDTSQPCSAVEPKQLAIADHWQTIYYTGVAVGFGLK